MPSSLGVPAAGRSRHSAGPSSGCVPFNHRLRRGAASGAPVNLTELPMMGGRSKIGVGEDNCHGTNEPGGEGEPKNAPEDGRHGPRGRQPGRLLRPVGPAAARAGAPAATAVPAARARARRVGPDHPHHRRAAPPPPLRLPAARRPARRHHRDPQLRPRRLRHVALVGHGPNGGRDGPRPRQPPGRGRRVRGRGPHRRSPAPAARVHGDHLRHVGAPGHDLEHVARGVHPHLGADRPRPNLHYS